MQVGGGSCDALLLAVPSFRGRTLDFALSACRSAHALHEEALDAAATAAQRDQVPNNVSTAVTMDAAGECSCLALSDDDESEEEDSVQLKLSWTDSDDDGDTPSSQSAGALIDGQQQRVSRAVYEPGESGVLLARRLTHPDFRVTGCFPAASGSVLWARLTRYQTSATHWTHSFRGEEWLTEKDWLARMVQLTGRVSWLPESYAVCEPAAESGSMVSQVRTLPLDPVISTTFRA